MYFKINDFIETDVSVEFIYEDMLKLYINEPYLEKESKWRDFLDDIINSKKFSLSLGWVGFSYSPDNDNHCHICVSCECRGGMGGAGILNVNIPYEKFKESLEEFINSDRFTKIYTRKIEIVISNIYYLKAIETNEKLKSMGRNPRKLPFNCDVYKSLEGAYYICKDEVQKEIEKFCNKYSYPLISLSEFNNKVFYEENCGRETKLREIGYYKYF